MMPLISTNRVVGTVTKPESESLIISKKVSFAGPSVIYPLPSTMSIATAQAPASPQSHARTSPMVKGKSATVIAPSEAQNDGSQSTATSFAPPVNHQNDFVGVCMCSFFILCEGALLIFPQAIGFTPPTCREDEDEYDSMSNAVNSEMDAFPNIILLPFGMQSLPPLHIRAPSWSHLLRLLAKSSTSRLESTSKKYSKLRTVVQFTIVSEVVSPVTTLLYAPQRRRRSQRGCDTILWFSIDQPVPPNTPDGAKYDSFNPDILPWSYTQLPESEFLPVSTRPRYTIPATDKLPYPTLPITFPDLALYLQAALEESKHIHDTGVKTLEALVRFFGHS